jgi:threonine dehydratase
MSLEVTTRDIDAAAQRIEPYIRRTPVLPVDPVKPFDSELFLKLDCLQVTGSFKPRGAFSVLTSADIPEEGVVAASGGNFGRAVAYAALVLGHHATIFVPATSPEEKIGPIESYGADVRRVAGYYNEALEASTEFAKRHGGFVAHAYDQKEVVAGQGTCGRECSDQVSDIDTILVAVGGGGLIGGIASWFRDSVRVIAVEPELCPSFSQARKAGHPVDVDVSGVASSSLGAARIGDYPWYASQWIDDSVLVTDQAILEAQAWLWNETRVMAEPPAATPIAALLTGTYTPGSGERVVAVISGANFDPATFVAQP